MGLMGCAMFTECYPWNDGCAVSWSGKVRRRAAVRLAFVSLALMLVAIASPVPAKAQQASPPSFDPRQAEKRFDASQSGPTPAARSALQMPRLARSEASVGSKPLLKLRRISLIGARTLPAAQLITAYQPCLGKEDSQAELVAIAAGISGPHLPARFHLSRCSDSARDVQ